MAEVLPNLEIAPDAAEVMRYLGYPIDAAPDANVAARVARAIESAWTLAKPRATYAIFPIESQDARALKLANGVEFHGQIGEFLNGACRLAVFVATAGPELPELSASAMARRDFLGGLIYNAIGSAIADKASLAVIEVLRLHLAPGEGLTLPYSPGYCGMSLAQQRTVFSLLDAPAIGVELLPTYIMRPVKSVSGIIGLGPQSQITEHGKPCDKCPLDNCRMRR